MNGDPGLLGDLMALAAAGRTPAARRIGSLAIVFLILATVLGVWGLVGLAGGARRGGYRPTAGHTVRFTRGDLVWVAAPVTPRGTFVDVTPIYYVGPEAAYRRCLDGDRFDGQLRFGVEALVRARFADEGDPVPARAYTLEDNGSGRALRAEGEAMLIAALALTALAIAGLWYASRSAQSDSEIG